MTCFARFLVVHLVAWGTPVAAHKPKREADDGECAAALTPMQVASSHAETSSVENTLHGVAACEKLSVDDEEKVEQLKDGMPGFECSCLGAGEHGMVFSCVKDQDRVFVKGPRGDFLKELLDERAVMKKMNDANVPCVPKLMNTAEELEDAYPFIKMRAFAGETRPLGEEFGRVRYRNDDYDWLIKEEFKYFFEDATIAGKIKDIFSKASKYSVAHDEAPGNFLVPTDLKADSACPIYIIDFPEYSYGADAKPVSTKASWWKNCCYVKRLFSQLDCSGIPAHKRSQDYEDVDTNVVPRQWVPYRGDESNPVWRKNDPDNLICT